MNFSVSIPFADVEFKNAKKRHKKYFKNLFFETESISTETKYKITVDFEKIELDNSDRLYLEEDAVAQDGSLYISDTKNNKVKLDFSSFGKERIRITAEPFFDLYYLYNYILEPLLIVWASAHGILYVHASTIKKNGKAYVLAAWRHTGKTSSIFSLAEENIKFMGDDFCVLFDKNVYLYPKYINIFSYNFQTFPWLYDKLPSSLAARIKISVVIKRFLFAISQKIAGPLSKVFYRLSELAEISTNTKVTPRELGLPVENQAPLSKTVIITKADSGQDKMNKLKLEDAKQKLLAITAYEIGDFLDIYQKYKYFYPENPHPIIESFEENYLKSVEKNLEEVYEKKITSTLHKDAYIEDLFSSK